MSGGLCISDGWDSGRWDIVTVLQGDVDFIHVWEGILNPPLWIWVDPVAGTLEAGEQQTLNITVDIGGFEMFDDVIVGDESAAEIVLVGPHWSNPPILSLSVTYINDVSNNVEEMPMQYALHQNYPNPFNPATSIKFDLVDAQQVKLSVYNLLGQEVAQLVDQPMQAGYHTVKFDAAQLASGVYFYRLDTQAYTSMKKMVLVK